jgi:predicted DNA-binding ribbon-helix-helix protein
MVRDRIQQLTIADNSSALSEPFTASSVPKAPLMLTRVRGWAMKSKVIKRSIVIAGHKTSVSLEDEFWGALKEIAAGRHMTLSDIVGAINKERQHDNLSSAIRLFVLGFYLDQLPDRPAALPNEQARQFNNLGTRPESRSPFNHAKVEGKSV